MPPTSRVFKAGEALFLEGSTSQSIFIIKKGAISLRKRKGQKFVEIAKIGANEVIGELSFFDRQPRSATAVAIVEVEALELTFEALEQVYKNIPDYLKTIMASLAGRLRNANEQLKSLQRERVD